jgi:hypothetical protein
MAKEDYINLFMGGMCVVAIGASGAFFYDAYQRPDFNNREDLTAAMEAIESVPGVHYSWTNGDKSFMELMKQKPKWERTVDEALSDALEDVHGSHLFNHYYDAEFSKLENKIASVRDSIGAIEASGAKVDPELVYVPALVNIGNEIDAVDGYSTIKIADYFMGSFTAIGGVAGLSAIWLLNKRRQTNPADPKKEETTD